MGSHRGDEEMATAGSAPLSSVMIVSYSPQEVFLGGDAQSMPSLHILQQAHPPEGLQGAAPAPHAQVYTQAYPHVYAGAFAPVVAVPVVAEPMVRVSSFGGAGGRGSTAQDFEPLEIGDPYADTRPYRDNLGLPPLDPLASDPDVLEAAQRARPVRTLSLIDALLLVVSSLASPVFLLLLLLPLAGFYGARHMREQPLYAYALYLFVLLSVKIVLLGIGAAPMTVIGLANMALQLAGMRYTLRLATHLRRLPEDAKAYAVIVAANHRACC